MFSIKMAGSLSALNWGAWSCPISFRTLKNVGVRRYLRALPIGVHRQVYVLHQNGREFKRVELGGMVLSDLLSDLPYLAEVHGRVMGVGFEQIGRAHV